MLLTQEQMAAANKANLETLSQLSRKAFDGVEKIMELNVQVAKTLLQENAEHLHTATQAKDLKEYFTQQAHFIQPMTEKAIAYGRHFYTIANATQTHFNEVSQEALKNRTTQMQELMTEMTSSKMGSSDAMVNLMKQAVANANTAVEVSQKAVKQVFDMSSHQTQSATNSALKASDELLKSAAQH